MARARRRPAERSIALSAASVRFVAASAATAAAAAVTPPTKVKFSGRLGGGPGPVTRRPPAESYERWSAGRGRSLTPPRRSGIDRRARSAGAAGPGRTARPAARVFRTSPGSAIERRNGSRQVEPSPSLLYRLRRRRRRCRRPLGYGGGAAGRPPE